MGCEVKVFLQAKTIASKKHARERKTLVLDEAKARKYDCSKMGEGLKLTLKFFARKISH